MVEPDVDPPEKEKSESDSEKQARIAKLIEELTGPSKDINKNWVNGKAKLLGLSPKCERDEEIIVVADIKMEAIQPEAIKSKLEAAGASKEQVDAAVAQATEARGHLARARDSWLSDLKSIRASERAAGRPGPGEPRNIVSSGGGSLSVDRAWDMKNQLAAKKRESNRKEGSAPDAIIDSPQIDSPQQTAADNAYLKEIRRQDPPAIVNIANDAEQLPRVDFNSSTSAILGASQKSLEHVNNKHPSIMPEFLKIITVAVSNFFKSRELVKGSSSSESKTSPLDKFAELIDKFKKSAGISNSSVAAKKQDSPEAAQKQDRVDPAP